MLVTGTKSSTKTKLIFYRFRDGTSDKTVLCMGDRTWEETGGCRSKLMFLL